MVEILYMFRWEYGHAVVAKMRVLEARGDDSVRSIKVTAMECIYAPRYPNCKLPYYERWMRLTDAQWFDTAIEAIAAARDQYRRQRADLHALEIDAERRGNELAAMAEKTKSPQSSATACAPPAIPA